jgi:hypothetical protein
MDYTVDDVVNMDDTIKDLAKAKPLTLTVDGGFAEVPVIEVVRAIRAGLYVDVELLDKLTKYALMGKVCTIKADGVTVGEPFVVNSLDIPWDRYPVFKLYPAALEFVFNLCQSYIVKKSMLPLKSTPPVVASEKGQDSATL